MARTKATERRFPTIERRNTRGVVKPFIIKEILLQQKTNSIKRNGQIKKKNKCNKKIKVFFRQKKTYFKNYVLVCIISIKNILLKNVAFSNSLFFYNLTLCFKIKQMISELTKIKIRCFCRVFIV